MLLFLQIRRKFDKRENVYVFESQQFCTEIIIVLNEQTIFRNHLFYIVCTCNKVNHDARNNISIFGLGSNGSWFHLRDLIHVRVYLRKQNRAVLHRLFLQPARVDWTAFTYSVLTAQTKIARGFLKINPIVYRPPLERYITCSRSARSFPSSSVEFIIKVDYSKYFLKYYYAQVRY